MAGLALPRAQQAAPGRPSRLPARGVACPPAIMAARPKAARLLPATRQRAAGPLALSLLGHTALLAAGLAATLLLPAAPPARPSDPPAFSVELAIVPTPAQPAPAELADVAPLPQPPPDALVVPLAADMAAVLPAPEAPPAPAPVLVANATEPAAVSAAPPLPPPVPPPHQKPARPVHRAAAKPTLAQRAPAAPGPSAAPAPPADTTPILIATPRFRMPPRPPVYPRRAIELRAQGEALIGALLDPSGTPHDIRVLRSSGHPTLDRAALDAVGGWAFEPGRRAGHPVAARVEIPVRFTLH